MSVSQKKNQLLYDVVKFPNSLKRFLIQNNYVLLIKGPSGTGKTTLALSILFSLQLKKRGLYISTRVSPPKLFEYFSWLERFFKFSGKTRSNEDAEYHNDLAVFADGRLYESGTLYERISNELLDVNEPVIIIDSIDAVEFLQDKETTRNNAKILQSWCERAGAKLIITIEDQNDSSFDFIADGIVELKEKFFHERKIRNIILSKLRGIRIERASYVFTLNKGMFQSFNIYNPVDYDINFSQEIPSSDHMEDNLVSSYFPSGYMELDKALGGGFPRKKIIDLILESSLSARIIGGFLNKIILDFVKTENLVLFHGFNMEDSKFLESSLKSNFDKAISEGLIKIISTTDIENKEIGQPSLDEKNIINKNHLQLVKNNILKMKEKYPKKMLLNIMGYDISDRFHNDEDINYVQKSLVEFIKLNTDLSFLINRNLGNENQISQKSDMVLRLFLKDDTMFLQSQKPWSQLFAVFPTKYEENATLSLEPIV